MIKSQGVSGVMKYYAIASCINDAETLLAAAGAPTGCHSCVEEGGRMKKDVFFASGIRSPKARRNEVKKQVEHTWALRCICSTRSVFAM